VFYDVDEFSPSRLAAASAAAAAAAAVGRVLQRAGVGD